MAESAAPTGYQAKLLAGLRHERPEIVVMSAEKSGLQHIQEALPDLLAVLERWRDCDDVVIAAIHALAEIGDDDALDALVAVLAGRSLRQRLAAGEALTWFDAASVRGALRRVDVAHAPEPHAPATRRGCR